MDFCNGYDMYSQILFWLSMICFLTIFIVLAFTENISEMEKEQKVRLIIFAIAGWFILIASFITQFIYFTHK
jgi:cytochrome b561